MPLLGGRSGPPNIWLFTRILLTASLLFARALGPAYTDRSDHTASDRLESHYGETALLLTLQGRCPMFEEREWNLIARHLHHAIEQIKDDRERHNASLDEARRQGYGRAALTLYAEPTGYREAQADNLWHRRASLFGPACAACGKPLRTPRATLCAACGAAATKCG